jgi:hypothetical protein
MNRKEEKGGTLLVFADFWREDAPAHALAERCGCYVFAVQNGGGCMPIYVGKATKTFKQETFNPANRTKFHEEFIKYKKGRPVMFFVIHPHQKGTTNYRQIAAIEDHLIQAGVVKNSKLRNVKGTKQHTWSINGVVRSGPGQKSTAAKQFCAVFDF